MYIVTDSLHTHILAASVTRIETHLDKHDPDDIGSGPLSYYLGNIIIQHDICRTNGKLNRSVCVSFFSGQK